MKRIIFGIVITALGIGCSGGTEQPVAKETPAASTLELKLTAAQMTAGGIEVTVVKQQLVSKTVVLNGVIDVPPQHMVSITCPMGGYVKSINLLPGQEVKKGEVLVTMEDPAYIQLQQDFLVARSRISYLQKESQRQKELAATEAASQKSAELAASDYQVQWVSMQALKQKLALIGIDADKLNASNITRVIGIRSPIHGFISKVPVNRGRYVNPTETLAELVDPGDIHASLTVFEKDLSLIKKNQPVAVSLVANPAKSYPAEVLLVSRNVDEKRTGMVHCHFERHLPELVPGMAVKAGIDVGHQEWPVVPEEAVIRSKGKNYVFVEKATQHFVLTEVTPGAAEQGMVALTGAAGSALSGKKVVSRGAFSLMGMLMKSEEE